MKKILIVIFLLFVAISIYGTDLKIEQAFIQSPNLVEIQYSGNLPENLNSSIIIEPNNQVVSIEGIEKKLILKTENDFRLDEHYYIYIGNAEKIFLRPEGILDSLYSTKPLGYNYENNKIVFRVFAPRAKWVKIVFYEKYDAIIGDELKMVKDKNGVWEHFSKDKKNRKYYGYKVWGPTGEGEIFDSTIVVADPYSPVVVTQNHYTHPGKTLILPAKENFDWQGDGYSNIEHKDLIIYEMHIRDLTAHPSSGVPEKLRGSYTGLIHEKQRGGLSYIEKLGINAVELLPVQDFGNIEIYYKDSSTWIYNNWNPYERNHWGYMTSYFFAPESYYATGGTMERGKYNGEDGRQVNEFKQMVKTFHDKDIAVIMDVVYNHVSQYDNNSFKYIDKFYYFRLNDDCSLKSVSGCGNDFRTERPMARRMIVESMKHWIKEYHIDGFRFDLAKLIDWQTCDEILQEALKINPNAIIIAEPWGGGYEPDGFSDHNWAAWNDQIRNGVKGQNPNDGHGFIFGKWQGDNNVESMQRYIMGSLRQCGGQFNKIEHSINYLESHDDNTMGDFIRIGLRRKGETKEEKVVNDIDKHTRLTPMQLKLNKLAALFLLTSQGPAMLHEGQEFARSKVIAETDIPDGKFGKIDHNSYEKDDETNWLNYDHAAMNKELVDYYRKLIELRKKHSVFRHSNPENFKFMKTEEPFLIVYELQNEKQNYLVTLNGSKQTHKIDLPKGDWEKLADGDDVYFKKTKKVKKQIEVPATSGLVLLYVE